MKKWIVLCLLGFIICISAYAQPSEKTQQEPNQPEHNTNTASEDQTKSRVSELLLQLSSEEYKIRQSAHDELEKLLDTETILVLDLLQKAHENTKDPEVKTRLERILAHYTRWRITPGVLSQIPNILELLEKRSEGSMRTAVGALRKLDPKESSGVLLSIVELLIDALRDKDNNRRTRAVKASAEMSDTRTVEYLIFILRNDPLGSIRGGAAIALGEIGDSTAVETLMNSLKQDTVLEVRAFAAQALGRIGDKRAVELLITFLKEDSEPILQEYAVVALGEIGDGSAVKPIIEILKKHPRVDMRWNAALALGRLGDTCVGEPLITALKTDSESSVRGCAVAALAAIGDQRAVEPLMMVLKDDTKSHVKECAAIALTSYNADSIDSALEKACEKQNTSAAIALAWRHGDADFAMIAGLKIDKLFHQTFLMHAGIRWGNVQLIEKLIVDLPEYSLLFKPLYTEVLYRLPKELPPFDFKANYAARKEQARKMLTWFDKNGNRIVWQRASMRYILLPKDSE